MKRSFRKKTYFLVPLATTAVCLIYLTKSYLTEPTFIQETKKARNEATKAQVAINEDAEQVQSIAQNHEHESNNEQVKVLRQMHRPNWKFETGLYSQLQDLQQRINEGDSQASYILALNYRYCYNAPFSQSALDAKMQELAEFSDPAIAIDQLKKKFEYCAGIDQAALPTFYSYLERAANDGYVPAQEEIGKIPAEFYMKSQGYEELKRDDYVEVRDNFTQQKMAFLTQASKHGSIKAMIRLSNMYHSQNYGANGFLKAYAINRTITELTENNEIHNRYSWLNKRLYDQLSQEEYQQAVDMSEEWLSTIKRNGTVYSAH